MERLATGLSAAEPSLDDDPAVPAVAPLALLALGLRLPGRLDDLSRDLVGIPHVLAVHG